NLFGFRKSPGAREIGRHTVGVRVDVSDVLGAVLHQLSGPGLIGQAVLEVSCEISQLRRQGKFGALYAALVEVAGPDVARHPHAGKVGFAARGSWCGRGEVRLTIARTRDSLRRQVEPLGNGRRSYEDGETDNPHRCHDKPSVSLTMDEWR